jgi:Amino acid permease
MESTISSRTSATALPAAPVGTFGRASSGLVRQVRTDDVMFYGWQQIGLGYIVFIVAAWDLYPGASMELATAIAGIAGVIIGVAYAMLSRVYPRSGGDYVFMSRILSPPVGLTMSVSLMFWQLFYTAVNGAWLAKYGLAPMFASLGLQLHNSSLLSLSNWLSGRWGLFASGAFVILFFIGILARGIGIYFRTQRWSCYIALVSLAVTFVTLVLAATHVIHFDTNFNAFAGHNAYAKVIADAKAQGANLSPAFSLKNTGYFALWPAFSLWFAILSVSFGGEVKDTQKGQMVGINAAVITMGVFMAALMCRRSLGRSWRRRCRCRGAYRPKRSTWRRRRCPTPHLADHRFGGGEAPLPELRPPAVGPRPPPVPRHRLLGPGERAAADRALLRRPRLRPRPQVQAPARVGDQTTHLRPSRLGGEGRRVHGRAGDGPHHGLQGPAGSRPLLCPAG